MLILSCSLPREAGIVFINVLAAKNALLFMLPLEVVRRIKSRRCSKKKGGGEPDHREMLRSVSPGMACTPEREGFR